MNPSAPEERPRVGANFALTWDARIATRNLTPSDYSSRTDKRRLFEIRAEADAVLIGRRTLAQEQTRLGLPPDLRESRVARGLSPWPLRVLISNTGQFDPAARIFHEGESTVVIYSTTAMPEGTRQALEPLTTLHLADDSEVNLEAMLASLSREHGVHRLVCEGGGALFRSLAAADRIDEINLTLCPLIFGGLRAPTITGLPGDFLPRSTQCRLAHYEVVGDECFLCYEVVR